MRRSSRRRNCSGRPAARIPTAAEVRRALAGGADLALAVTAAEEHRISPLLWRALGAADALDALGPDRAALHGTADAFAMEAPPAHPARRRARRAPAHRRRARAGHLQGPGGGGALPPAGPAPDGGHRPAAPPRRPRPRARGAGGGRLARRAGGRRRTVRHRPRPRRGAVLVPRAAFRPRVRVAARHRARPREHCGPTASRRRSRARPPSCSRRTRSWWCSPRTPASRTTGSSGWCGSPTSP